MPASMKLKPRKEIGMGRGLSVVLLETDSNVATELIYTAASKRGGNETTLLKCIGRISPALAKYWSVVHGAMGRM